MAMVAPAAVTSVTSRGAGTGGSGSQMTPPPEIYLGSNTVFRRPDFFGKKYFLLHTHMESTS